ncbi:MAG: hypothetical protein IKU08_04215 [Clostridia bacterium]|nr:hypothetical protein [Clostridia bacterium]
MSDFIQEFYYGNIDPQECTTELKPSVMKCLNELASKEKHLMDALKDEDNELFSDYVDTYIRFLSICNTDSFIAGFRLGSRFTYDTFVEARKEDRNG